jgi:hypothetical protein
MTTYTPAKDGFAFMSVITPSVALEYELPLRGALTGINRKHYEELQDLADMHRTSVKSSPYRLL